jgi:predicted esterase
MGGRGALYFAYRMPDRFAAVAAVSAISPILAWGGKLAHLPLWIIHGTADLTAPLAEIGDLAKAIEKAGGHPRFDTLEGRDHSILDIYNQPEIFDWLKQQERAGPK